MLCSFSCRFDVLLAWMAFGLRDLRLETDCVPILFFQCPAPARSHPPDRYFHWRRLMTFILASTEIILARGTELMPHHIINPSPLY